MQSNTTALKQILSEAYYVKLLLTVCQRDVCSALCQFLRVQFVKTYWITLHRKTSQGVCGTGSLSCRLVFGLHQAEASEQKWWGKSLSCLEEKDDRFHFCTPWSVESSELYPKNRGNTQARTRTEGPGHKTVAATLSLAVITSLPRLRRVLDALPSLQLSRQSLAVSALRRVCSPTGTALMAGDELICGSMTGATPPVSTAPTCRLGVEERRLRRRIFAFYQTDETQPNDF